MESPRSLFLSNTQRMVKALGDPIPAWSPDIQRNADRALGGEICRGPEGQYAQIDFDHVDWTCASTYNRENVQMYLLRFHVLETLASAYRQTKDERYPQAARRYIAAFLRDHPTRDGWEPAPYDGATQYDLRVGCSECPGWLGTLPSFLPSASFDDDFFNEIIAAARAHLTYLSGHVFPNHNIRVTHGDVLLTNGVRLDFLPEAERWREQGRRIVNDAVQRQVLPDGVHSEAAPLYHGVVMGALTHLWRMARSMPELGLVVPTERIAAMHDYAAMATRPDGAETSIGDTRYSAAKGQFHFAYVKARAAFRAEAGLPNEMPATAHHFPVANQVFLRDHWGPDATYMTFDATTRRSYHWHAGRNTIQLFANGRALLVDTGYPFRTAEFPHYGTRTAHHSTINLNGWSQSQSIAQLRLRQAPGYDLVEGFYDGGYWPMESYSHGMGVYGEHHRTLLWVRNRFMVVLDHVYTTSEAGRKPNLESVWQFSEGKLVADPAGRRATTAHPDSNLLMMFPLLPDNTKMSVHEGEREPMRGWVPMEWGQRCIPAPMLRLVAEKYDAWNANLAAVLVPFTGAQPPKVEATAAAPSIGLGGPIAGKVELKWADGSMDRLVWTPRLEEAIDQNYGLDTDASLVHLHFSPAGALLGGLAVEGHFLDLPPADGRAGGSLANVTRIETDGTRVC